MKKQLQSFLIISFLFLGARIQAQNKEFTPLDLASVAYATETLVGPDQQRIAYRVAQPADPLKENASASYHVYVYDISSGETLEVETENSVSDLAFRAGSGNLTWLSAVEGGNALYEYDFDRGKTELFRFSTPIRHYAWSPDGKELAFIADEPKETDKATALPVSPEIYEENLSYDKAFITQNDLKETIPLLHPGHALDLVWSQGGNKLALAQSPSPLIDEIYMFQDLWVYNTKNLSDPLLIEREGKLGQFAFSPNDNQLVFIGGADIHDPIDGRLWVADATTGKSRQLLRGMEAKVDQFEFNSSGELFVLLSQGVYAAFGKVSIEKDRWKEIRLYQDLLLNDFSLEGTTGAGTAESATQPSAAYSLNPETGELQKLSHLNSDLDQFAFAKQEVITYAARDGLEIEGILIYPIDYEEGKRYPLITMVHGGPESHYDNGWLTAYSLPGQVAAHQGYFVFYPNYRGSTGRGEAFAKISQGDMAGMEFDDIVDGIDYLIDRGWVDRDRVGVTGGSYGGYATAWMSTYYTDRFAAGVMFVGISNNLSKWGTSDIPEEMYLVHARGRIWDHYEKHLRRSPIYWAGQAKTPLLIMHGAEDTRVHPSQSMELYRHIKTRTETPVRLVLYPGEGHGNRKAAARLDYNLRMIRWFNHYLKQEDLDMDATIMSESSQN